MEPQLNLYSFKIKKQYFRNFVWANSLEEAAGLAEQWTKDHMRTGDGYTVYAIKEEIDASMCSFINKQQ